MPSNLVEWAIVVVAAVQCVTFLVVLILLLLLLKAFLYLRHKAPPVIGTAERILETAHGITVEARDAAGHVKAATVRLEGTADFVTEQAVRPVIFVAGVIAGVVQTVRALIRHLRRG